MNGLAQARKTPAHKGLIWLVVASVHLSSFAPWQLVYAVEVEKKETPSATAEVQPEQEASEPLVSVPSDFTASQAELDARVAQRVERFQMAQATEPPVTAQARAIMDNARDADDNDNHVAAALLSLDVTNRFSGTTEAVEALRLLTDYSLRLHKGEFPKEHIDTFEAGLPTFQEAASIDSRYVLIAFWTHAAQYANRHGPSGDTRRLGERALLFSKEFMGSYPGNYLSMYASNYVYTAADILGEVQQRETINWLKNFCETQPASIARCGARAVLAMHYAAAQNPTAAASQRRKLLEDWETLGAGVVLGDATVPGESKAYILMQLGLAQRSVGDLEAALASFEIVTQILPNAGHSTEASAIYAVQTRHQIVPNDHATAIDGYLEFLAEYPDSRLAPEVRQYLASAYMAADDYDAAYAVYEGIQKFSPLHKASASAQANMDYIIKRELSIANAGSDTPSVFAMACGPMALHNLFSELGFESSVPEIIRLAHTTSDGTTMSNLIAAASELGMSLTGVRAVSLDELTGPFIAFVRGDHFVVVRSYNKDGVVVKDLNRPARLISRAEFETEWSGESLCIQGTYRVAESLQQPELDSLIGGVVLACEEDENGDNNPLCEIKPADELSFEQCVSSGTPKGSGSDCESGCCGAPGAPSAGNEAHAAATDPWLSGPGMPLAGLHQTGDYIDVGIPAHVGTVTVNPFTLETRINRTDLVVNSRGTLQFNLTMNYSNPRKGVRLWRDTCTAGTLFCCWYIGSEWTCDLEACNGRRYVDWEDNQERPQWRSNAEPTLVPDEDDPDILILGMGGYGSTTGRRFYGGYPVDGGGDVHIEFVGSDYLMKRNDGYKWGFSGMHLQWVEDPFGNRMTYTRSGGELTISMPSPDTRTIWFNSDRTLVEFRDGSEVLRTIEYVSGVNSLGEEYDAVKYDGEETVRYYRTVLEESVPGDVTSEDCEGHLDRRINIYKTHAITRIVDRPSIDVGDFTGKYFFEYNGTVDLAGPTELIVSLPNGLETTITRDVFPTTEATVSVNPAGRTMLYKRDVNFRLGQRSFYDYDNANWTTWTYEYFNGRLSTVNAPNAAGTGMAFWARYEYDVDGRLTTVKRGPGSTAPTWTWQYSSGYPYPTKYIDPTGVETSWTYMATKPTVLEKYKPPVARNSTNGFVFARNSYGEINSVTDPQGKVWDYDYDAWGNLDFAETPLNEAVEMEWNALGQLKKVWDPMDKRTEFDYITGTSCSSCGPTGLLQEVKRFYTEGSTEYHRSTSFEYDVKGNLELVTDPGGEKVKYAYNDMNEVTSITFPFGSSEAKTTGIEWKKFGRVQSIMDAEGKETLFDYDYAYRLDWIDDPLASPAVPTELTYSRFGNLKSVKDGKGQTWTYTYNDKQWLTDITDGLTGSLSTGKNLHYAHDDAGRVTQVSAGTGVGNGGTYPIAYDYETGSTGRGVLERVDYGASSAGGWASFGYNHLGAVTSMDDSLKSLFSMPDLVYTYDDAGRLDTLSDWNGTLDYDYNAAGAVTDFTDWEGNVTHYGYNDLHELTALSFLDGTANEETWSFAYTAAGQPDDYTHPNGMTTDYVYDTNGILTDILHKDGSTVKQGYSYDEYDDVYNIKKVTHEDGSYWTYAYDDRYRLTSAVRHNASDTIQANYSYAYDAGDNMSSKTEPWVDDFADGATTGDWSTSGTWSASTKAAKNTSNPSGAGIYKTVNDDDIEFRFTYAIESSTSGTPYAEAHFRYNTSTNERLMVRFQSDKARLYYHNGTAWSTPVDNTAVTTATGTKYKVRVEADGDDVKVWRSPAGGGAETLVFNQSGMPTYNGDRLRLNVAVNTVVSYDDIMILASDSGLSRTTTMTYRANNEIDTAADYNGTASYTFDAWGRMSTEAKNSVTRTYSWTSANLLAGINSSDSAETDVTYAYTGDLKRGWRLENGSLANYYTWDAGFNVIGEEAVGEPRKTFVPGLAEVVGNDLDTSADFHFLTTDHLGSTRGMFDASKASLGAWEFTPYGSPFNFAGPPDVTQLYTGHDLDKATGQYYAPFRYLNAGLGRWSASDPAGMVDGPNMYAYIGGDPMNSMDPWGLKRKRNPGEDVLDEFGLGGDRLNDARVGSWSPLAPIADDRGRGAVEAPAALVNGLVPGGDPYGRCVNERESGAHGLGQVLMPTPGIPFLGMAGTLLQKTVREIMKTKLGKIRKAPLPPGTPSIDDILDITMEEVQANAKTGDKGWRALWKLLTDNRFEK